MQCCDTIKTTMSTISCALGVQVGRKGREKEDIQECMERNNKRMKIEGEKMMVGFGVADLAIEISMAKSRKVELQELHIASKRYIQTQEKLFI